MPAKSKAQQRLMGAELGRRRAGKRPRLKIKTKDLRDFARTKLKGLPKRVKKKKTTRKRKKK